MASPHNFEDERINRCLPYILTNLIDVDSVTSYLISKEDVKFTDLMYVKKGGTDGTDKAKNLRFLEILQKRAGPDAYQILLEALREMEDSENYHVADHMEQMNRVPVPKPAAKLNPASELKPASRPTSVSGCELLHEYCRNGNVKKLNTILRINPGANVCDSKGRTPLFYAVEKGHMNVVTLLTGKYKAKVNVAEPFRGWTPLHFACNRGDIQIVMSLVSKDIDINAKDKQGQTPLFIACTKESKDSAKVVDLLVQHRALRDLERSDDTTPLMAAVGKGSEEIVEALLKENIAMSNSNSAVAAVNQERQKPRVSATNIRGETALHHACIYGHYKVADMLIRHGATVRCHTRAGLTPLYCASQVGRSDIVNLLLISGAAADVNVATKEGATPLYIASEKGHKHVVTILIRHNAQVNFQKARTQHTPLITAANSGHKRVVEKLLASHAEINLQNKAGWTPLHAACYSGHTDVAIVLIEHQAEVDLPDKEGATPLHLACYHGHSETTLTATLVKRGAKVHVVDKNGRTPLHDSCLHPHKDIAQLLIQHGASVVMADSHGKTPLHYASQEGHADLVDVLLSVGADMDAQTTSGDTPLHLAGQNGHQPVTEALINAGAAVNVQNKQGDTPLHYVIRNNHLSTFEYLVDHADCDVVNHFGETPKSLLNKTQFMN